MRLTLPPPRSPAISRIPRPQAARCRAAQARIINSPSPEAAAGPAGSTRKVSRSTFPLGLRPWRCDASTARARSSATTLGFVFPVPR
ncbi:MAG: hypothetical protein V4773_19975 [Verrucomicrobiota bacterium]